MVKIRKPETDTEHELAQARVEFADAILAADNSEELLLTLNDLFVAQVAHTLDARISGKKSEARRRKQATDEIFTIMMCAMYRAQAERD